MKQEEFENKMNSIQEKIGQEASSLILDEIGALLTDNKQMNTQLEEKDTQITKLKQDKETLQAVNGNLLQQVAMGKDTTNIENKEKEEKEIKPFDFRSAFDEYGNFKQ